MLLDLSKMRISVTRGDFESPLRYLGALSCYFILPPGRVSLMARTRVFYARSRVFSRVDVALPDGRRGIGRGMDSSVYGWYPQDRAIRKALLDCLPQEEYVEQASAMELMGLLSRAIALETGWSGLLIDDSRVRILHFGE